MSYNFINVTTPIRGTLLITLNRPKQLNSLNSGIINEIISAINKVDNDPAYNSAILYGGTRVFAAGADIKEMEEISRKPITFPFLSNWDALARFNIPLIAAVEGFAFGGGCELAMLCDIIYSSKSAKFGQPEIKIGVIPGCGGTQRLIRAVGKARAMEMILTGDPISGEEAEKYGLVAKTFKEGEVLKGALSLAETLSNRPRIALRSCKKAVNYSNEVGLSNGVEFEQSNFYKLFGSEEQREGMTAFIEKRAPSWNKL